MLITAEDFVEQNWFQDSVHSIRLPLVQEGAICPVHTKRWDFYS